MWFRTSKCRDKLATDSKTSQKAQETIYVNKGAQETYICKLRDLVCGAEKAKLSKVILI